MINRKKEDNLLQRLENNEAVLLMYLADELPAEDRAEVEQLLAVDAGLRAELERLREAMDLSVDAIREVDRFTPLPVPRPVALRRMSRVVRQWQVARLTKAHDEADEPRRGLRYPWWTYPLATAAAVLLAFLVWWGNKSGVPGNFHHGPMDFDSIADNSSPYVEESFDENHLRARDLQESFYTFDSTYDIRSSRMFGRNWVEEDAISADRSDDPLTVVLWDGLNQQQHQQNPTETR